ILNWPDLKKTKEIDFNAALDIRSLVRDSRDRIWGLTGEADLFLFDPNTMKIAKRKPLKDYGDVVGRGTAMFLGPDDELYVLFTNAIVRIDTNNLKLKSETNPPVSITAGGDIHNNRIYFGSGSELWSYTWLSNSPN